MTPGAAAFSHSAASPEPISPAAHLYQAVGAQDQQVAIGGLHLHGLEGHAPDADRRSGRKAGQQLGLGAMVHEDRRDVPGAGDDAAPGDRVVDRVNAGGEVIVIEPPRDVVQVPQHLLGRQVQRRERLHRGPQPAHDRRGADAVTHHIADDQGNAAARQREGVEPVAADLGVLAAGQVTVGDLHASQARRVSRQHALLEGRSRRRLAPVAADAVDALARLRREHGCREHVDVVERLPRPFAQQGHAAKDPPASDERDRQQRASALTWLRAAGAAAAGHLPCSLLPHVPDHERLTGRHRSYARAGRAQDLHLAVGHGFRPPSGPALWIISAHRTR